MAEGHQMTGRPFDGRNEKPEGAGIPGERPVSEDERSVGPPASKDRDHESGSRAAEDGPMTSEASGPMEPTPGIPDAFEAPDPSGATEGDPPGGSAANQPGRAPDR